MESGRGDTDASGSVRAASGGARADAPQGDEEAGSVQADGHGLESFRGDPLEQMPDAVFELDRSWRFTYLNQAGRALLQRSEDPGGRDTDHLIGRDARDSFPEIAGTALVEMLGAVAADRQPRAFEYQHEQSGRWYEVRANASAAGVTVFVRDIDDRRRADLRREAQMGELTAVLESLPAATVLVDEDGRILSTNRVWTTDGELLAAGGIQPGRVGDSYLAAMGRSLAPADHAVLADGLAWLTSAAPEALTGTFEHEYATDLGSGPVWFRLQAARVAGSRRVLVRELFL